jgi:hypothetical protein
MQYWIAQENNFNLANFMQRQQTHWEIIVNRTSKTIEIKRFPWPGNSIRRCRINRRLENKKIFDLYIAKIAKSL